MFLHRQKKEISPVASISIIIVSLICILADICRHPLCMAPIATCDTACNSCFSEKEMDKPSCTCCYINAPCSQCVSAQRSMNIILHPPTNWCIINCISFCFHFPHVFLDIDLDRCCHAMCLLLSFGNPPSFMVILCCSCIHGFHFHSLCFCVPLSPLGSVLGQPSTNSKQKSKQNLTDPVDSSSRDVRQPTWSAIKGCAWFSFAMQ